MSIGQQAVAVYCGWEGNRRSGVALAMRHVLSGLSTYGLKGLRKADEHSAYTPVRAPHPSHLYILNAVRCPHVRTSVRNGGRDQFRSPNFQEKTVQILPS